MILMIMLTVTEVVYIAGALAGESSADGHTATDSTLILIDRIYICRHPWFSAMV